MFASRAVLITLAVALAHSGAVAQPIDEPIVVAISGASGSPTGATPIGLTASGRRIIALEPSASMAPTERRLLLVGGLDGSVESTAAVLDVLRWRSGNRLPVFSRRRWQMAAVPCALPDACDPRPNEGVLPAPRVVAFPPEKGFYDAPDLRESRYLWRWTAMLGPDLVIEVRSGPTLEWRTNALGTSRVAGTAPAAADSFAGALGTGAPSGLAPVAALQISGPRDQVVGALRRLLQPLIAGERSPLREALAARAVRRPLEVATLLARRYPATPIMSYIPALSWIGALEVSRLTHDPQYRDRARAQMAPFLNGDKPSIAEPFQLTSLAGHQAFAALAAQDGEAAAGSLAITAADFLLSQTPDEIVRFATSWTDDMFMATSVLARAGGRTGDPKYGEAVTRLLTTYATRLQRPDGLFIHAVSGPHAWGRGNGFAAFGLMEALTHLPESWPGRLQVEMIFQRHMSALQRHQAPDGAWHEVIDEPGSYREFTATAMITTAMARGVRLGWLAPSFKTIADRGWNAVTARVSPAGELVDVCTGTGAGANATREFYLNRPAIFGPDDRGGAMALTAALEMHALSGAK